MSKREDRRAAARVVREQLAREKRRKRAIWTSVTAVLVIVIGGFIGWGVYANQKAGKVNVPTGANKDGNAVVTGSGPVVVEDYIDFICPYCKVFHDDAKDELTRLVSENKITLVTHPVAYLDRFSTNRYSTRSSAASGCAADGGRFTEYVDALFTNQPAEGSAGPDDAQLISLGLQAGLTEEFSQCVKDKRYVTWAKKVSDDAGAAGVTGTPTVFVNGKKVQANAAAIVAAVNEAGGAAPTPTS
ncbi:DsbA family protein [Allorhizocola rhizosphaerae]|uniref:DsbA family protein n=1 Tax=Allorhizocola rhizosphaerae TaxID=1872709 RepID=UPI000E3C3FD1|nr:thioredoxin domain-containing protein [Allorhizocola rhizosphaerae]